MLTRRYVQGIVATWIACSALWWAWGDIPRLIAACVACAAYLGVVLWHMIELEHIERSLLPGEFRFVGLRDRGGEE